MASSNNIIVLFIFLLSTIANAKSGTPGDEFLLIAEDLKKNMKPDSALIYYEKAAVEFQKQNSIEKFVHSYNQIGVVLTRQDKYEDAKKYLDKALSTGLASLDSNNLTIATTYISLGVVYNAEENYDQSLNYHFKALSIRLYKLGPYDSQVATSYGNIGNVYRNKKDFDKSVEAHLKAMRIREHRFGATSAEIIDSYVGLGNAYRERKEYMLSLGYFEKALNNKIIQRGEGHKDLSKYYKNISEVYFLMGNNIQGDFYKTKSEDVIKG